MNKNIDDVIKVIDDLFTNFNRDTDKFTVDYDEKEDGLYCHYTPYPNDPGYAVSDCLISVCDTSQDELQRLHDYLAKNRIGTREGFEWEVDWGWKE